MRGKANIGPIPIAVPLIAIVVIRPGIAVVTTAIIIIACVFAKCVALHRKCPTSHTGRHRRFGPTDE
jgi:hypothetical protein